MSETKEFAQAIAYALSEYFLQIAGDDYRELYVERKAHLTAISELEKQLGDANDRIPGPFSAWFYVAAIRHKSPRKRRFPPLRRFLSHFLPGLSSGRWQGVAQGAAA